MKSDQMLDNAAKVFCGVKLGGAKGSRELAALDRGVIAVALLVAALDGEILPAEWAALMRIAKGCRGVDSKNLKAVLDDALPEAGRLLAMSRLEIYTEHDRLAAFEKAAKKALPSGFAKGSMADLRRAFALWVSLGVADGEFSVIERIAITSLVSQCAVAKRKALIENDFFRNAESIARDMISPRRRDKAAEELERLITRVEVKDGKGRVVGRSSASVAVKLALLASFCVVGAASADAGVFDWFRCLWGEAPDDVYAEMLVDAGVPMGYPSRPIVLNPPRRGH